QRRNYGSKTLMWCRADDIAQSYGYDKTDATFDDPVDKLYEGARVLFIDELGRETDVKNSDRRILRLFHRRYDNRRVTNFTTNLTFDELEKQYGESLVS